MTYHRELRTRALFCPVRGTNYRNYGKEERYRQDCDAGKPGIEHEDACAGANPEPRRDTGGRQFGGHEWRRIARKDERPEEAIGNGREETGG